MARKRRKYADMREGAVNETAWLGQVYLWARSGMYIPPPEGVEAC